MVNDEIKYTLDRAEEADVPTKVESPKSLGTLGDLLRIKNQSLVPIIKKKR